ncbi:MAG: flagellar protein FlgN [Gammaproteobacteria bacterium]|nr:flagellar protein FlgN [Gammaproteobacteria bacterium]
MTSFESLLTEELSALRAVLATLETERAALEERAPDALIAASNAKAEAVARAARLEQERRDSLAASPGTQPATVNRLLNDLKKLAAECRQRNEVNGQMIRGQRRRVEGSLNVLRGGNAAPDTYGRDGETRLVRGGKKPLASY